MQRAKTKTTTRILGAALLATAIAHPNSVALAQFLPDPETGVTKEEVAKFSKDFDDRAKMIPQEESQLYHQLSWVNGELTLLRSYVANPWAGEQVQRVKNAKKNLVRSIAAIERLNCVQPGSDLIKLGSELLDGRNKIADLTYTLELQETVASRILQTSYNAPVLRRIQQGGTQSSNAECKQLKKAASNIKSGAEDFFEEAMALVTKQEREEQETLAALAELEPRLVQYRKQLIEAQSKVSTKQTLGSNLWLMILSIGLLSIHAIVAVRLFPEEVMMEWVASGQVIQFVTVMILLSAIMALGLSGLIAGETLGTLLGGIGGYVLSQGVGRSVARLASRGQASDYETSGRANATRGQASDDEALDRAKVESA